jgi:hypothetical protein
MPYRHKIHLFHNGRAACGLAPLGADYGPIEQVTCKGCLNAIAGQNRKPPEGKTPPPTPQE